MAEAMFNAPVGQISSTPDLRDPLGTPNIITGTEYMKALGSLGYNVENMTSNLPTISKIAEAGTSLLNQSYRQQMEYQKSQADLAYSAAQTAHLQSDTDYNNQTLAMRVKSLDLTNQKNANDLHFQNETMDSAIAAEKNRLALQPQIDANTLAKSQNEQEEAKQRVEHQKQAYDLENQAIAEKAKLFSEAPLPDDPDYFQKWSDLYGKYSNAVGNPATAEEVRTFRAGRDQARQTNQTVIQRDNDATALQAALNKGTLGAGTDVHTLSMNHQQAQSAIAQSNIVDTLQTVQSLINKMPTDLPPQLQKQFSDLVTFRDHMRGILANPEQGMNDVRNGMHAGTFDANGKVSADIAGDIEALNDFYTVYQKRGVEAKLPTATVTTGLLDQYGRPRPPEVKTEGLTPQDAASVAQQAQGQLNPIEQQNRASISAAMQQRMFADPGFRDMVDQALTSGKTSDWKRVYQALGVGVKGFQTGGSVDEVSTTQPVQDLTAASLLAGQQVASQPLQGYQTGGEVGSTDTVPAMLTPGEYVLNAQAARAIGAPTLNRMNQAGQGRPLTITPPAPLAGSPLPPITMPTASDASTTAAIAGQAAQAGSTPYGGLTPVTTGPAQAPIASTGGTGLTNPDINTIQQGAKITHYGYPGDSSWDSNSGRGVGDRENSLQPGVSVALTQSMRRQLFPDAKPDPKTGLTSSTGKTFTWNGRTYRDDDNAPEPDNRIDVYNPSYTGVDKGVTAAQLAQRQEYAQLAAQRQGYQRGGPVTGYAPAARTLGGSTPSIAADLSTLPGGNPLYGGSTERVPVSAPGFQRGGPVGEGSIGGRGGGRAGGGDENIFGGGTSAGGGGDGWLPQQQQKRRRFHPRLPGQQGPDIPDEMQKKLAKLSHDYLSGISGLIQNRPEFGPQLLRHARNQLASNLGTGAEDEEEGGQGQQQDYGQPAQQFSPAQYAMTATGNQPG